MIKVAYIVSTLKRCGPVNQLSYIVKYLDKSKFKPIVITLSPETSDSLIDKFNQLGVEHLSLNLSRTKGVFKVKEELLKVLNDKKIDLVHTQGIRADVLSAKYLKNYKRVCTLRNYPYYDYTMTYGKIKGYIMAYYHLRYLKQIDNANACSKSVSNMLKEKRNYDIKYVQNGVDTERYSVVDDKIKKELRLKLKLPLDKTIFISVGNLSDRKDPITIIKAFQNLNNNFLIFLGDGELRESCLQAVGDNENIRLVGSVSNVNEYLQASDYLISASKAEGLPNTVIEAMACGLPCILSDIPPHNEILDLNNTTGRIFNLGSSKDLIDKIVEIEKQDYKEISNCCVKLIENNLSAKIMSEKYQELYLKMF